MKIAINKDSILDGAQMAISVIARDEVDSAGNSLYPILSVTNRDRELLSSVFDGAYAEFASQFSGYVGNQESDGLVLNLPDFYESMTSFVSNMAKGYFSDYLTGYWLRMKGSTMYEPFLANSVAMMESIKKSLFTRKAPM